jgi:hypothetical protein
VNGNNIFVVASDHPSVDSESGGDPLSETKFRDKWCDDSGDIVSSGG